MPDSPTAGQETAPANAGSASTAGRHACAFFENESDEYAALLPFSADCIRCGERCLQFLDPRARKDRLERLRGALMDVTGTMASGQLQIRTWADTYLRSGSFEVAKMLQLVQRALQDGRAQFGRTQLWGDMEWAASGVDGAEDLIEYESRLNNVLDGDPHVVICAYRVNAHSASTIMDVLRAHPFVLVGRTIQPNPLYVPTEQFLADLDQRRRPRAGLRSGSAGQAGD
jgi:hypothetical protein